MIGDACVFALTQITNQFDCEYGELVTRRAGPDIACHSLDNQKMCISVYEYLKTIGLAEFEFEDDLTKVPHGVWAKIQFGGLMGLQSLSMPDSNQRLANISQTIQAVVEQNEELNELPVEKIIASMKSYRTRRGKK